MRKLNDVLKKTGVEIYREITAVALYSMITSLVLVTVVMFVPLWTALVSAGSVHAVVLRSLLCVSPQNGTGQVETQGCVSRCA